MENIGVVVFGDFVYRIDCELFDGNDCFMIVYELFYYWFGDYVICELWFNLMLNELWVNYLQYLWDEYCDGLDEVDFQVNQEMEGYMVSVE